MESTQPKNTIKLSVSHNQMDVMKCSNDGSVEDIPALWSERR